MTPSSLTHKHRSTTPVPAAERPTATRAHRARRRGGLPVAALLGILLIALTAYLATRG